LKLFEKHYARIYTDKPENIEKIKEIIKDMDEYEADYLPKDLIDVFTGHVEYVYNGKFYDIDMDALMTRCWQAGIYAFYAIQQKQRYWEKRRQLPPFFFAFRQNISYCAKFLLVLLCRQSKKHYKFVRW
jgi:hypothetical protein